MQDFKKEDALENGYRYKYGSSSGIKVGDKVMAYKKGMGNGKRGYNYNPLGTMTIIKVENNFAIMSKDDNFVVDESTSFKKD